VGTRGFTHPENEEDACITQLNMDIRHDTTEMHRYTHSYNLSHSQTSLHRLTRTTERFGAVVPTPTLTNPFDTEPPQTIEKKCRESYGSFPITRNLSAINRATVHHLLVNTEHSRVLPHDNHRSPTKHSHSFPPALHKTQLLPPPPPRPEPNPDNKHEHSMWLSPATRPRNRPNPLAPSQGSKVQRQNTRNSGKVNNCHERVNLHRAACKTREPRIKLPANS